VAFAPGLSDTADDSLCSTIAAAEALSCPSILLYRVSAFANERPREKKRYIGGHSFFSLKLFSLKFPSRQGCPKLSGTLNAHIDQFIWTMQPLRAGARFYNSLFGLRRWAPPKSLRGGLERTYAGIEMQVSGKRQ
jgi:hypothetical protein